MRCPAKGECFQSHFGSIGAGTPDEPLGGEPLLSIPLWFDWGEGSNLTLMSGGWLSIPLWFDWGQDGVLYIASTLVALSIPLWFDWGRCHRRRVVELLLAFNPTLVRLGPAGPPPT